MTSKERVWRSLPADSSGGMMETSPIVNNVGASARSFVGKVAGGELRVVRSLVRGHAASTTRFQRTGVPPDLEAEVQDVSR